MKKNNIFALVCAVVFVFAVSACSSDNDDIGYDTEPYLGDPIPINHLKDVSDLLGTAHYDLCVNNWYMLDKDDNRYYLFSHQLVPYDSLKTEKILVEDAVLRFSGEIYETNPIWMESVNEWLKWASVNVVEYNYPKEWLQSNENVFCLMWPCTLERVE